MTTAIQQGQGLIQKTTPTGLYNFATGQSRVGVGGAFASGAAAGALAGSILPGIGTGVGAVVGGIVGAIGTMFGGDAKATHAKQLAFANAALGSNANQWKANVASGMWQYLPGNQNFAYDPSDWWSVYWLGTGPVDYRGFPTYPSGYTPFTSPPEKLGIALWSGSGKSPVQIAIETAGSAQAAQQMAAQAAADQASQQAAANTRAQLMAKSQMNQTVLQANLLAKQGSFDQAIQLLMNSQNSLGSGIDTTILANAMANLTNKQQQAAQASQAQAQNQQALNDALVAAQSYARNNDFSNAQAQLQQAQSYAQPLGPAAMGQVYSAQSMVNNIQAQAKQQQAQQAALQAQQAAASDPLNNPQAQALQMQLARLQAQNAAAAQVQTPMFSSFPAPTDYSSSYSGGDGTDTVGGQPLPSDLIEGTSSNDGMSGYYGLGNISSTGQSESISVIAKAAAIGLTLGYVAYLCKRK